MRRELVTQLFREKFGGAPELWARAPGRVDLMGSHTDYNLGFVLTLPISRETWVAARARDDGQVRMFAANLDSEDCFDLTSIQRRACWGDYVRGVAWALAAASTVPWLLLERWTGQVPLGWLVLGVLVWVLSLPLARTRRWAVA